MAQVGATILAVGLTKTAGTLGLKVELLHWLSLQSVLAMGFSGLLRLPAWWLPMQGLFLPILALALALKLPAPFYLIVFLLFWLVFRSNTRERVPLYLSNRTACKALLDLIPPGSSRILDLGSGLGGTLSFLARQRADLRVVGIESAPLPFLIGWLRLCRCPNAKSSYGDLWQEDLGRYDVVYAFLSPEPMPALWAKACREMRPGSLLISNSFEVPGVVPVRTLSLADARQTQLLIFEIGEAFGGRLK